MAEPVLRVEDLAVGFRTEAGLARAVRGLSFELRAGEVLALVGESGCGKSVTARTIMGLTRSPGTEITGRVIHGGRDLVMASAEELRHVRGAEIAMVFQDPLAALNPVLRVGAQVAEQVRAHTALSRAAARERAVELLARAGIPDAAARARAFPHELSGGLRQRVMVAMALAHDPGVLIADEPTTALDVTIQAQVLRLLEEGRERTGSAMLLITHDLGVVAEFADRVLVMYAGMAVETGTPEEIFHDPQHPYTWGLLGSLTRIDGPAPGRLPAIAGRPPSPLAPPAGCPFGPRCPHAMAACGELPALEPRAGAAHLDRCILPVAAKRERREVEGRIGLEVVT